MMTINKITQILEEWAPLDYAEDFDVGLLVGNKNDEAKGFITHDCLAEVVDEGIEKNVTLLYAFIPLYLKGFKIEW